jgi:hypothetical protein
LFPRHTCQARPSRGASQKLVSAQGLTIHSSRSRFAARLNSGVRPHKPYASIRHIYFFNSFDCSFFCRRIVRN